MIRNIETESLVSGDEFCGRLGHFNRFCFERIRAVFWIILNIPCKCWYFFKYVTSSIIEMFLRQYIAAIILVLSTSLFPTSIVVLRGNDRIITAIYCLPFIICSSLSLLSKKGWVIIAHRSRFELLERQQLLANRRNGQTDQHSGYGAIDKRQRLQRTLENLMEPRQKSETDLVIDTRSSKSRTQLNCTDEKSAGPSHAPDCTNRFTIKSISEDSCDFDEPPQRISEARISADAVRTFGLPAQIFGADSYRVLSHSSEENFSSDESVDAKVKKFKVPAEIH